jgi:hypothetical protein
MKSVVNRALIPLIFRRRSAAEAKGGVTIQVDDGHVVNGGIHCADLQSGSTARRREASRTRSTADRQSAAPPRRRLWRSRVVDRVLVPGVDLRAHQRPRQPPSHRCARRPRRSLRSAGAGTIVAGIWRHRPAGGSHPPRDEVQPEMSEWKRGGGGWPHFCDRVLRTATPYLAELQRRPARPDVKLKRTMSN